MVPWPYRLRRLPPRGLWEERPREARGSVLGSQARLSVALEVGRLGVAHPGHEGEERQEKARRQEGEWEAEDSWVEACAPQEARPVQHQACLVVVRLVVVGLLG